MASVFFPFGVLLRHVVAETDLSGHQADLPQVDIPFAQLRRIGIAVKNYILETE
jgi:hypothetical protein